MENAIVWLKGKKTYLVILLAVIAAAVQALGIWQVPELVWIGLGFAGLGTLRSGVGKLTQDIATVIGDLEAMKNGLKILIVCCLLCCLAGCQLVKMDAVHAKHVGDTLGSLQQKYPFCAAGDVNSCSQCVAIAAAECKYIKEGLADPNKPIKMDKDFQNKFLMQALRIERFAEMCGQGEPFACKDGARHGVNTIGLLLNAVNDANGVMKY
jgi:hypothetical protein